MNPLFQMLNSPNNAATQLLQKFQEFRKNFSGDPQAQVQQLLCSGRITQAQYNNAVQMAQQLQHLLK